MSESNKFEQAEAEFHQLHQLHQHAHRPHFIMRRTFPVRSYTWSDGVRLTLGTRTLIMGILNATPDSFSDGGRYLAVDAAVAHARAMAEEGADILDIGGESTRPGSTPVTLEEELARVLPVIRAVKAALPAMPLSIDTYKAEVARQAVAEGVHIVNDVWGLKRDPAMARVAAAAGVPVIIGHNRLAAPYKKLVQEVVADVQESLALAKAAGVAQHNIWLDPGIGFAKDGSQNLQLMGELEALALLGYPLLLGTSRKRFIRDVLQLPPDDVVEGNAATVALGIAQGCQLVRVHEVRTMKRVAAMTDAIVYAAPEGDQG